MKPYRTADIRSPERVRYEHTQLNHADPATVFALLCPVREADWVPGWRTDWVISRSGLAEEGCVFQTPPEAPGLAPAVWVVTHHDPANYTLAMVKLVPEHSMTRLWARLEPAGAAQTHATIAYEFTVLGEAGEEFVAERDEAWYGRFMQGWEQAMNACLRRGQNAQ